MLILLFTGSLFTSGVYAQQNNSGKISGHVYNNNQTPAAFATITLLKTSDSGLVKSGISDSSGAYHFKKIPFGNYVIAASVTGTKKAYTKSFSMNHINEEVTLPEIILPSNAQVLQDVQVKANSAFRLMDRAANLTFTWNFGNQKVKVNQYKNTGIQKEENSLKSANSGTGTPK